MKLFVAFHYHEEDKWIKDLIIPLIKDLDIAVESGENMFGDIIVLEVPRKIKESDCMIAFVTKSWQRNPWVRDELVTALAKGIPALEIRDKSVEIPDGIPDGRQRLDFDLNKKEELIRKLIPVLFDWKKKHDKKNLLILPESILEEVGKHIRDGFVKCTYQFKDGDYQSEWYPAELYPVGNVIAVDIKNVPSANARVQIVIKGPNSSWSCGYLPFNSIPINLKKEA